MPKRKAAEKAESLINRMAGNDRESLKKARTTVARASKSASKASASKTSNKASEKKNTADNAKSKKRKARKFTFEERIEQLEQFIKDNGHCAVSQRYEKDTSLGNWANDIRKAYRCVRLGKKPDRPLTFDMILQLESMGFKWKLQDHEAQFEQHLAELAEFKRVHGHCDVPAKYEKNPQLGNWINNMRQSYKARSSGGTTRPRRGLTQERVDKLEALGFRWQVEWKFQDETRQKFDEKFEHYFSLLEEYQKKNAHCNVPKRSGALGSWCQRMREAYRHKYTGRKSYRNLSDERIKRLEKIGFVWKVKGKLTFEVPQESSENKSDSNINANDKVNSADAVEEISTPDKKPHAIDTKTIPFVAI